MGHFVSFDQVSKIYRMGEVTIKAADKISFEIDKGEFCVIVGPSGAGKTTVLNMLGGMDTCDEGTILLDGSRISDYNQKELTRYRRYDVGFVFQFYNLVQNLTALENVELASEICENPLDASERSIKDGDKVQVFNDRGTVEIVAKVTPRIMPGVVSMGQGAWHDADMSGNKVDKGGCINTLTSPRPTPLAKANPQHTNLVEVKKA